MKQKLKIVILHQTLGLINRGSEVSTHILANELVKKNQVKVYQSGPKVTGAKYQVKIISPQKNYPKNAPSNFLEKIMFRLQLDARSRQVTSFTKSTLKYLQKDNPDIIIATNGAGQVKIVRKAMPNAKLVVFGRAGIGHDDLSNLSKKPDLFVALSPTAAEWASTHANQKTRVVYIPNPFLSLKKSHSKLKKLPGLNVLCVAALSSYKNVKKVTSACRELQVSLTLIGDGEESASVADALSDYPVDFRWIKQLDPSDIHAYYQAADVFCFIPDSQEAFGRVYLEAMAAGLPIVATDDPIRREIIGPKGIYVQPSDQEGLRHAIISAAEQGKVDYAQELKRYNLKTVTKQLETALYDLLKQ